MSLIRWNPSADLTPFTSDLLGMQRDINRMFDTFFRGGMRDESDLFRGAWTPAIDIAEYDREYQVRVELPGVNKEDVKITMQNNILTIRGEKKQETEQKDVNLHRSERWYGAFQRSFTLPTLVKSDKIEAHYKDGILTIVLPKAEEAIPKSIEVKLK
jgi:HSP20 family protein